MLLNAKCEFPISFKAVKSIVSKKSSDGFHFSNETTFEQIIEMSLKIYSWLDFPKISIIFRTRVALTR